MSAGVRMLEQSNILCGEDIAEDDLLNSFSFDTGPLNRSCKLKSERCLQFSMLNTYP